MLVVAEDTSGIVGFGSVTPAASELTAGYVHPRAIRSGVGGRLLRALETIAAARHCDHLEMNASLNAEAFYGSHGYDAISRGVHYLAGGIEMICVRMRKMLASCSDECQDGEP